MKSGFQQSAPKVESSNDPTSWLPDFPNPPDLRFDYYKLLDAALQSGLPIGKAPVSETNVAIVGAGVAGLTAARELFRAGYNVTIYEASDRIGGRLFTRTMSTMLNDATVDTGAEMGAMRMPFFDGGDSSSTARNSKNCLLSYYLNADQVETIPSGPITGLETFPNPGHAPGNTGIYINDGYGPSGETGIDERGLIMWPDGGQPENAELQAVLVKVGEFVAKATAQISETYAASGVGPLGITWKELWAAISDNYDRMTFEDIVSAEVRVAETGGWVTDPGWLGGMGMTEDQTALLATIGTGDGSWGAFYNIGALWWMRCSLFGFSSNLMTITGLEQPSLFPHYNATDLKTTNNVTIEGPVYRGVQTLPEVLLFGTVPAVTDENTYPHTSMFDMVGPQSSSVKLYLNAPVTNIDREDSGTTAVTTSGTSPSLGPIGTASYDHVIVTAPIWAVQTSIEFGGFSSTTELPFAVKTAMAEQHLIGSCKVFYPLKAAGTPYWDGPSAIIPQILVSDTAIQDVYGLQWKLNGTAAVLVSYTWEDDARKFAAYSDSELGNLVMKKLDQITSVLPGSPAVSEYIDTERPPTVMHWVLQPTYHGCGKLYRSRAWKQCYDLLTYNQTYSKNSGLYFSGESYAVEGGWTEPALRGALDAVIHVINNGATKGATFNNGFSFSDYPVFDTRISPNENYPPHVYP